MISPSQIRAGRSILNVKQSELAKAAGISLATLNNIERGVGDPRASTLDSIERALYRAGVSVEGDGISETLQFHKLARPSVYETFQASQRILESLGRESLLKVERVLFFIRRDRSSGSPAEDPGLRLCLMLEGRARTLLFDQVSFTFANGARTAEAAGVLYAAFLTHGAALFQLEAIQDDTTLLSLRDAFDQLIEQDWVRMRHPKGLVDLIDDWDSKKERFGDRDGHPMAQLLSVTEDSIVLEDDEILEAEDGVAKVPEPESPAVEMEAPSLEPDADSEVGTVEDEDASDDIEFEDFEAEEIEFELPDGEIDFGSIGSVGDPESR